MKGILVLIAMAGFTFSVFVTIILVAYGLWTAAERGRIV